MSGIKIEECKYGRDSLGLYSPGSAARDVLNAQHYSRFFFFCYFLFQGNLCIVAAGAMLSWTSPVLPYMKSDPVDEDNPVGRPITETEASWIGSLVPLGAVFGSFFAGYVTERLSTYVHFIWIIKKYWNRSRLVILINCGLLSWLSLAKKNAVRMNSRVCIEQAFLSTNSWRISWNILQSFEWIQSQLNRVLIYTC